MIIRLSILYAFLNHYVIRIAFCCAFRHHSAAIKACAWDMAFSVRFKQSRISSPNGNYRLCCGAPPPARSRRFVRKIIFTCSSDEVFHQSIQLLATTKKPISLIVEEIGLTNSSYFCKWFKTQMGITPHQYRKKWTST